MENEIKTNDQIPNEEYGEIVSTCSEFEKYRGLYLMKN